MLLKNAPKPPSADVADAKSLIEAVHEESHDPNAMLLSAISDQDREAKINGIPLGFLSGRQKSLDKFAPTAPAEFKEFLEAKQKGNKAFLEFYTGEPDVSGFLPFPCPCSCSSSGSPPAFWVYPHILILAIRAKPGVRAD